MGVFRVRGVVVATGVPAAFALLAGVLAFGSTGARATSAEDAGLSVPASGSPSTPDAGPVNAGPVVGAPWGVSRQLVRSSMPPLPETFRIRTDDPVVFITIDDGVTKDRRGLALVEARRLPVTAFLTTWTIKDSARYFERITAWGSIQNHSATHASMARSSTDLEHEICYSQRMLGRSFGSVPWLMRPPYGLGPSRMEVQVTADRCGISDLVMWNAVIEDGRLSRAGGRLRPGDIVLLHFTPHLAKDLRAALRAARSAGLQPADLAAYLPRPVAAAS